MTMDKDCILESMISRIEELIGLPPGWDGNGEAAPLNRNDLKRLSDLLGSYGHDVPAAHIFPTIDGDVEFEWDVDTPPPSS